MCVVMAHLSTLGTYEQTQLIQNVRAPGFSHQPYYRLLELIESVPYAQRWSRLAILSLTVL